MEAVSISNPRDALALGQTTALILLGHERSEEAGMAYLAEWLTARRARAACV